MRRSQTISGILFDSFQQGFFEEGSHRLWLTLKEPCQRRIYASEFSRLRGAIIPQHDRDRALRDASLRRAGFHVGFADLRVRDIVGGYVRILQRAAEIQTGSIFNLASGKSVRVGDALKRLLSMSGVNITVETDPSRYRVSRIGRVVADVRKAELELNWRPAISFDETLTALLEYHRASFSRV